MCAKVQRIMHIMMAIEQKSASNLQILLKSCSIVEKNHYICTQIPLCAVSKRHRGNEIVAFNYLFDIKKRRKFQDEKGLRVDRLNARAIAWASTYQTLGTSYGLLMG